MGDSPRRKLFLPYRILPLAVALTLIALLSTLRLYRERATTIPWPCQAPSPPPPSPRISYPPIPPPDVTIDLVEHTAAYFARYPQTNPIKEQFGEKGQRAVALKKWLSLSARVDGSAKKRVDDAIELAAPSIFPFLANPPSESTTPLRSLRERHVPESRGVVIPAGDKNLRMACHLVASILHTHGTELPVEIAYAGDEDLSRKKRELVRRLFPDSDIRFLDVLSVFNDTTLDLANGGWAIKPFAVLASSFSEVILADADTVFLQKPEVLFAQPGYVSKGALLFHDRLIDKGRYEARTEWWKAQVVRPSAEVDKSLVWTEGYAEEGDSGVVVVDKTRLGVWVGILHAAWQNSKAVREEVTYSVTYGDKESWWFGMELTEGPYEFERHYGGVAGWLGDRDGAVNPGDDGNGKDIGVCSYVIAHVDAEDKLLWYNGSLLRNKIKDQETFLVPTHWMVNGTWEKGLKGVFSCMRGGRAVELTGEERGVLEEAVEEAKRVDAVVR